jgi:hypothetical protein
MKILFAHSYFYKLDPKQWRFKQPYPPLGTILAAAVAREAGHQVVLFDTNLRDSPLELLPLLVVEKPDCVVIYDDGFNYLTKMCLTKMREAAFVMARESRKRGCTVVVSSSDAVDHYEKYLEHGTDFVIRGEGEETLKALLDCLDNDHPVDALEGIVRQSPSGPVVNPQRPVMRDLDALPLPAWDLVDMDAYRRIWIRHHGYFSLNLATTRGCPFKCNWCAKPIYGNRYTSRRETITRQTQIDYTHKKQTGGSGQFARVKLDIEPGEPGTDFEFVSKIVGGSIPKEYIPGVEKGLKSVMDNGILAGFPIIDLKATLVDGAYHEVDSSVLAFEIASRAALREALHKAGPKLLEPVMKVEAVTPEEYLGGIIGDLTSRRGQVQGQEMRGNATVISALVPLANMFGYVNTLRSMSQGRAQFTMTFDSYAQVPQNVADEVQAKFA